MDKTRKNGPQLEATRYFSNPFPDFKGGEFRVDEERIINLIEKYLKQITLKTNPDRETPRRRSDLYLGAAGIAYMFLKLYESESFSSNKNDNLKSAKSYISYAKKTSHIHYEESDDCAFLCGNAGIYGLSMAISDRIHDEKEFEDDLNKFSSGFNVCLPVNFDPNGSDEILVGRAGYLSGIYWLNSILDKRPFNDQQILSICDSIVASGRQYSSLKKCSFPLMYQYHGSEYLGSAHGVSSIYQMLLHSSWFEKQAGTFDFPNKSTTEFIDIKTSIDKLLELQEEDGNFPIHLDQDKTKRLVHWCHGGPGIIYLFAKSYILFGEEKYLSACMRIGELVWETGLLKKGPGICHGVAGSGYVFLILYRLTADKKYLYRASKFMEFLTSSIFLLEANVPSKPYSLYEGLSGTVCFLIDLLQPHKASFPFMDVIN